MEGLIRIRVPQITPGFRERVKQLSSVRLTEQNGQTVAVECRDVKGTLLQLVALLNELQLELTSLETEEPNLERVFLHLTGRGLRD
jgi:ABC-2 type transport system ATP-binding protein